MADQRQSLLHSQRERRNELRDPSSHLTRAAEYLPGTEADIGLALNVPITVKLKVTADTLATAAGVLFALGDATTCFGMAIDGSGGLEIAIGDVGDGILETVASVFLADGHTVEIVAAVIPGGGPCRVWINGAEVLRDTITTAAVAADASLGVGESNGVTRLVNSGALTDATIVRGLNVFLGQTPRQLTAG